MSDQYEHYGVMFSYYSAKTRAYLSYKGIPFVERYDGNALNGPIRDHIGKVMIPVVKTPTGELLQDTTDIIDQLEARHPQRPVIAEDQLLRVLTRIVEFTMDELWICTAMHTRWNDPESKAFIIHEFGNRIGRSFGLEGEAAQKIGQNVAAQMQSYLPFLGIDSAAGQETAVAFFEEASKQLDAAVSPVQYALGPRVSMMDFCLFTGYYAHQYRDAGAAQRFLKNSTHNLSYYIDTLHSGSCAETEGKLSLSEAMLNYLSFIGPSSASFAEGIIRGTQSIVAKMSAGDVCEARIMPFAMELGGQDFSRGGSTFSAWKLQRVADEYAGLEQDDFAQEVLSRIGWLNLLSQPVDYRLTRRDYQTIVA